MITEAPHSKAVVVLVHGMQEYSDRYKGFCQHLAANGYSSLRYDLLGHGKKIPQQLRGYFGSRGWHNLLQQLHQQVQAAHAHFPGQKVILFGHSMGTIIIRSYLQHYQDFDGLVLSGAPYYNPLWRAGKLLSQGIIACRGARNTSALLTKLTVGGYNRKVHRPATDFDWLCHNRADVRAYIKDPACGFPFTNQGYHDLYEGMKELGTLRHFQSPHPVPVFIINGRDDPCAGTIKQVWGTVKSMKAAGFQDLTSRIYPKMRHEILFEKNGQKVAGDIVRWLDRRFS